MKKKFTLITSILLILALAVTFVGCNKDKAEETPTTTEKVSTTEPTTFIAPEIEEDETTEPTTEEQTTKEVETTKKTVSTNSGSSSGSSGSLSSSNKKPVSTTKANSSGNQFSGEVLDDGRTALVTNANGGGVYLSSDWGQNTGSHSDDSVYETDPDLEGVFGANGR